MVKETVQNSDVLDVEFRQTINFHLTKGAKNYSKKIAELFNRQILNLTFIFLEQRRTQIITFINTENEILQFK